MAAAANIEQGAAAVYRCISKARLWNSVAEFLLCKGKAKIVAEGGHLRDISKFNFQQELKVLMLGITSRLWPVTQKVQNNQFTPLVPHSSATLRQPYASNDDTFLSCSTLIRFICPCQRIVRI